MLHPHRTALALLICWPIFYSEVCATDAPLPGPRGEKLDTACREGIWTQKARGFLDQSVRVPRDQVIGFALCTHDHGILKLSVQIGPGMPGLCQRRGSSCGTPPLPVTCGAGT